MRPVLTVFKIRNIGLFLFIALIMLCSTVTRNDSIYYCVTNIYLTKANSIIREIQDQHVFNEFTYNSSQKNKYNIEFNFPVSDGVEWPVYSVSISSDTLPKTGDSLIVLIKNYSDTSSSQIGITEIDSNHISKSIADSIYAKFIGIAFNDSIVNESDNGIMNNKINEKQSVAFSFQWGAYELKGTTYWVKITDNITNSGGCSVGPDLTKIE